MDILQEGRRFEPGSALDPRGGLCDLLGVPHLGDNVIVSTGATIDLHEWIGDGARLTLHAAEAVPPVPG